MKAFKFVISTLVVALLMTAMIACQSDDQSKDASAPKTMEQQQQEQAAAQPAQPAAEAAQPAVTATVAEITGTVEDTDSGVVITSDTGEYAISGQDLSPMIGKKVKVTGAVEESGGRYLIKVESVSEVQ